MRNIIHIIALIIEEGHKNIEMTLGIYNHVIERMKNDGYDIINKIF